MKTGKIGPSSPMGQPKQPAQLSKALQNTAQKVSRIAMHRSELHPKKR